MSFITGAVGNGRSVAVLAQVDDDDGEPLDAWHLGVWRDGEWRAEHPLNEAPVALCKLGSSDDSWAVLGSEGELTLIHDAISAPRLRVERIVKSPEYSFTVIRPFGNGLAVAGMARRVLWSADGRAWRRLSRGMPEEGPDELVGFEALVALSGDLYALGWEGEIWRLSDDTWHQVASPTNVILSGAAVAPSGEIVASGQHGTLLRGRADHWEVIEHEQTTEDLWSVATFRERVHVSSMRGIYTLETDRLSLVDDGSRNASYYHLSANDEIMISVGATCVLLTNGDDWEQII
jgi:hypothetical protein